jgi:hypothetical protein
VSLPQNVGPYENYKRIVKDVAFFLGRWWDGDCEFWQPDNRKEEKLGTSPHIIMRGNNYLVTIL